MTKEEIVKKAVNNWEMAQKAGLNNPPTLQDIIEAAIQEYNDQQKKTHRPDEYLIQQWNILKNKYKKASLELEEIKNTLVTTKTINEQCILSLQNEKTEMLNFLNKIEQSRAELQKESIILFKNHTTAVCDIIELTASIKSYQ